MSSRQVGSGFTIGIDVDEVVVDLVPALCEHYNEQYRTRTTAGETVLHPGHFLDWDFTLALPETVRDHRGDCFYRYLDLPDLYDRVALRPGAAEAIQLIRAMGHRVVFVTACSGTTEHQKRQLLQRAALLPSGHRCVDFVSAQDKGLLAGSIDLMIDDKPGNCEAFRRAILFSAPHNRTYLENGTTMVRPISPEETGGREHPELVEMYEDPAAQWRRIPYLITAMLAPRSWPEQGSQPGIPGYLLTEEMLRGVSIIAVSGKMHSGKSWAGRHLVERGYSPVAYANPFKIPCVSHRGMPAAEIFGSYKSDETRAALQDEGTKKGREVPDLGEFVWLRALEAQLWYLIDSGVRRIAVTDCRFVNEAEHIKALGGKLVRLTGRGGSTNPELAAHRSEVELDEYTGFDLWLNNAEGREQAATDEFLAFLADTQPKEA